MVKNIVIGILVVIVLVLAVVSMSSNNKSTPGRLIVKSDKGVESIVVTKDEMKLDLSGSWQVVDDSGTISIAGNLPGDIYTDLLAAGKIPDPYYGMNEDEVQWVADKKWTYSKEFSVSKQLLARTNVVFNADSLDTFADIFINGKKAGSSGNMFKKCSLDVKKLLIPGKNKIEIFFDSAKAVAAGLEKEQGLKIPYSGNNTIPYMNLIRKAQCQAGWDWGICLVGVGAMGEIGLTANDLLDVVNVYTEQVHSDGKCKLKVLLEVDSPVKCVSQLRVVFGNDVNDEKVDVKKGKSVITTSFEVDNPKLWWPAGYGEQYLYDLNVEFAGRVITKKIGLRDIEVFTGRMPGSEDYETDGKTLGDSLTVKVNGVEIFCKGANWIPVDGMTGKQTDAVYEKLLTDAVTANMNMIRVWGGGQFERDIFYDLCDEKGLLAWHDMMFACSQYPATEEFIDNVEGEVEYQVKRLRDHASIALWCGDNEVLGAIGWYAMSRKDRTRYTLNYARLNNALKKVVNNADPGRIFWPGSPCGGLDNPADGYTDTTGDIHYWKVWHGNKDFSDFYNVTPRFCSEFGFQSFPSYQTVAGYCPEEQMNVFSPVMSAHQKNNGGNGRIISTFSRYFRMPKDFKNFLYLSQVQQAVAIKTAVEYWRSLRPVCMGTLFWQLNDNWPVASWSSIEHNGKWKQLQYHAKRFYEPVICGFYQYREEAKKNDYGRYEVKPEQLLDIYVVSDLQQMVDCKLRLRIMDFSGKVVKEQEFTVNLEKAGSKTIYSGKVSALCSDADKYFAVIDMECSDGSKFRNTHFFSRYRSCELETANVVATVSDDLTVRLTADKPAFFVNLDLEKLHGRFSDNSFTLLPGETRTVTFIPDEKVEADSLKDDLHIYDLKKSYE